jgi:hypothetical protein
MKKRIKTFKFQAVMEAEMVVTFGVDMIVQAKNKEEALKIIGKMQKKLDFKNAKAIPGSVLTNEEYLHADIEMALKGEEENGIGGKLTYCDIQSIKEEE